MPGACQNIRSAPQKHPMPKMAVSEPSGNGGTIGVPCTRCSPRPLIGSPRPGGACLELTISVLRVNRLMARKDTPALVRLRSETAPRSKVVGYTGARRVGVGGKDSGSFLSPELQPADWVSGFSRAPCLSCDRLDDLDH